MLDDSDHGSGQTRRSALTGLVTGVVGAVGIGATSGTVAAQQTEWQNSDEVDVASGTDQGHHSLGAGLKLKNDFVDEAGDYVTIWEMSGDGVVTDANGNFPAPSDWHDEVPDTVDTYPRDHSFQASARHQGFTIDNSSGSLGIESDFTDSDEVHMFPRDANTGSDEIQDIAEDAAKLAAEAVPKVAGAISGLELAAEIYEYFFGTSGPTFDLTNTYDGTDNDFLRGGFSLDEVRIIADGGDFGTVDITANFGQASTGFEIYQQYDGFGGPVLDVTKK